MSYGQKLKTVSSLDKPVGELWRKLQKQYTKTGYFNVAAPLSSTPLPIYDWIIQHKKNFHNWHKVRFVMMDEMVEGDRPPFRYISTNDAASYERFARQHFLNHLDEKISVMKPNLSKMHDMPILDLLILALGPDGNYANVMPGTPLEIGWHIAHLTQEFRRAHTNKNSKSFAGANFREYGMSLGPKQVLDAKHIVVIIRGHEKTQTTSQLLNFKEFDPGFPLSIIYHPVVKNRVEFYITDDVFDIPARGTPD